MKLKQLYMSAGLIVSMTQMAVAMPVSEDVEAPLTLSELLQPVDSHEVQDKKRMGLALVHYGIYSSAAPGNDSIKDIVLCTAVDSTCATCATNSKVLFAGPQPSITNASPGTDYKVTRAGLASYLQGKSLPAGVYNIRMYLRSEGTNCTGGERCGTDTLEGGAGKACMTATYDGAGSVTELSATNGEMDLNTVAPTGGGLATVSATLNTLSLAVDGNSRTLTISRGRDNLARAKDMTYTLVGAPANTTLTTSFSGGGSDCSTLELSETCTLTITPGDTPSTAQYAANTPFSINISGSNFVTINPAINVLTYASGYQGGYIFSIDDTTATTGSIGGKVAANENANSGNPLVWASNGLSGGSSDVSHDIVPGIDENSTSGTGSPLYSAFSTQFDADYPSLSPVSSTLPSGSFELCAGKSDGACNSRNILTLYNQYITSTPASNPPTATPLAYYGAGVCSDASIDEVGNTPCVDTGGPCYDDWYLPALCEAGTDDALGTCAESTPKSDGETMTDKLSGFLLNGSTCANGGGDGSVGCFGDVLWTSTEDSAAPGTVAAYQNATTTLSTQSVENKSNVNVIRCVRALTATT